MRAADVPTSSRLRATLIGFLAAEPSWRIFLAALLIVGGAALAAKDLLRWRG